MHKSKTVSGSILYIMEMVVSSLLSLISIPITTHQLPPSEYGAFALAVAYSSIAMGIANWGTAIGYERNFFEHDGVADKSGALLTTVVAFVALNITVLLIGVFYWRYALSDLLLGQEAYSDLLVLVFLATGLATTANYYLTSLIYRGLAANYIRITIFKSVTNFALLLLFLLHFKYGVNALAYALVCSSIMSFAVVGILQLRDYRLSLSKDMLLDILKISLPLTPRIFFGFLGTHFDKIMLRMMGSMGGVGIYSIGQKVSYLIFNFMTALEKVFIPELYRKLFAQEDNRANHHLDYLTPYLYASVFAALMMALFSEELFIFLMPNSYAGAVDIIIILTVYYASMFFGKISGTQLIYAKKTHITTALSLIGIVVNVALNIPMIMMWGVLGAAFATMAAGITMNFIYYHFAQRYVPLRWEWHSVALIYGIFSVAALFTLVAHMDLLSVPYVPILIFKLAMTVAYLFLGARMGIVTMSNMRIVYNTVVGMLRGNARVNLAPIN